jgi:hypothetical protein
MKAAVSLLLLLVTSWFPELHAQTVKANPRHNLLPLWLPHIHV